MQLDTFTRAYIEAALWSSTDDDGVALDTTFGPADIAPLTLAQMIDECQQFQLDNGALISDDNLAYTPSADCTVVERAGHDFWLTRNAHGAGFWDGDWNEPAGKQLTKYATAYGAFDLYVGDDGLIYVS